MGTSGSTPPTQAHGRDEDVFVGRRPELEKMEALLEEALGGSGCLILVTGESGIGKTALAGEFFRRALAREPTPALWRGRCVEQYGTGEAYLPFLDALGTLLVGRARDATTSLLLTYAPTWCLQLPALATSPEAREALQQRTIGATKERMLREMGDVFEATAASSLFLGLLEDVQWADPSSADLVRHIVNHIARQRILILLTVRPGELETGDHPLRGFLRDMRVNKRCHEIALGPLGLEEVAACLEARFPSHNFPLGLDALIHRKTEGHPLFVASLVQFLVEHGDVALADGRWVLKRPLLETDFEAPENVRGVIRRKIDALREEDVTALQYGSVMGREFLSTVVARVLGADELALEERLARIAKVHRLINAAGEEELPDGALATRYRFANALYQEVLHEDLVSKKRGLMHRQIAEALLHHYGSQAPRIASRLAVHFEAGRDFPRAATYFTHAGDNAARLYANSEAEEHYVHALRLVERLPVDAVDERAQQSLVLHQKLGAVQRAMGRLDRALDSYTRMLEGAWAVGSPALECSAIGGICRALFFASRIDEMAVRTEEALRAAVRAGSESLRIEPLLAVSLILQSNGELAECDPLLGEVIAIARRLGHKPSLMEGLAVRGTLHYWQSEYARAEERLAEALALASELRDGFNLILCLMFLGLSRGNLGRMSEALAALDEGTVLARRNGDHYWLPRIANQVGWVHRELEDPRGALEKDEEGLRIAREEGNLGAVADALLNLALDYTHAGQGERAAAALEEARASSGRDRFLGWLFQIRLEVALAENWLGQGDLDRAQQCAERLLVAATRHGARIYVASAHKLNAEVALARGEAAGAAFHLAACFEQLQRCPAPLFAWRAHAARGRFHAAMGDRSAARQAYAEAATIVRAIAQTVAEEPLRATFLASHAVREVLDACE